MKITGILNIMDTTVTIVNMADTTSDVFLRGRRICLCFKIKITGTIEHGTFMKIVPVCVILKNFENLYMIHL